MSALFLAEQVTEAVGYLAAFATATTFYCRQMPSLRGAAIIANLLFITYGAMLMLMPVLLLHCFLLPLNLLRFRQALIERARKPVSVQLAQARGPEARLSNAAHDSFNPRDILWIGTRDQAPG